MKLKQRLLKWLSLRLLIIWVIETLAFVLLFNLFRGVSIDNWQTAVAAAGVMALLNILLWPWFSYITVPVAFLPAKPNGQQQPGAGVSLEASAAEERYFYLSNLIAPRVLAQQPKGSGYLHRSRHFFASIYDNSFFIEVLALQALLHHEQNGRQQTVDDPETAERFIRLLNQSDPRLDPMLAQLAQGGIDADLVAEVRSVMADFYVRHEYADAHSADLELEPLAPLAASGNGEETEQLQFAMLESLTNREMDVLIFLAKRLTNKEIAQKLGISTATVKRHTVNIYQKMGVDNRRQAMVQAHRLGLL